MYLCCHIKVTISFKKLNKVYFNNIFSSLYIYIYIYNIKKLIILNLNLILVVCMVHNFTVIYSAIKKTRPHKQG